MRDRQTISQTAGHVDLDSESVRENLLQNGLEIRVGTTATLQVRENASTGYGWMVRPGRCDSFFSMESRIARPQHDPNTDTVVLDQDGNEVKRIVKHNLGAPGARVMTLTGLEPGECTLDMVLAREWEFSWDEPEKGSYLQRITFNVRIQP